MQRIGASLVRGLDLAVEAVATAAFVAMFAAAIAQVVARYVLQVPLPWTEELARVLFTCAMLLGIAIAVRRDEHIRIDALAMRLPPRGRALLEVVFDLVVAAIVVVLVIGAVRMMGVTWNTRMISLGWMRIGYLYAVQLAALLLMLLHLALRLPARALPLLTGRVPAP